MTNLLDAKSVEAYKQEQSTTKLDSAVISSGSIRRDSGQELASSTKFMSSSAAESKSASMSMEKSMQQHSQTSTTAVSVSKGKEI